IQVGHSGDRSDFCVQFRMLSMLPPPPRSTLFPYTTLFRSAGAVRSNRGSSESLERCPPRRGAPKPLGAASTRVPQSPSRLDRGRSEEHTSELQSLAYLVCRLLLEKKKTNNNLLLT